ncbi:MAG: serine/threonine-protein kinase [Pirellulales bacterium]
MPSLCPHRQMLARFVLGDLPLADLESIGEHVESCEACQVTTSHFDGLRDPLLLDLPVVVPPTMDVELSRRWERLTLSISHQARQLTPSFVAAPVRTRINAGDYPEPDGYERGPLLSQGGFGVVFAARCLANGEDCVLKYPRKEVLANPRLLARFQRECLVVRALRHPALVKYIGHGWVDETPYLALERLYGQPLSQVVAGSSPLPLGEVTRIAREILSVLIYLNSMGAVHRDLKPSNLFRLRDGRIRLIDWGLATVAEATLLPDVDPIETSPWSALGTPGYSAPEQIARFATCDSRADLYSLGWTLVFLLTGQPPGRPISSASQSLCCGVDGDLPLLSLRPDLPFEWVAYLRNLLTEEASNRFASAQIALDNLPVAVDRQADAKPVAASFMGPRVSREPSVSDEELRRLAREVETLADQHQNTLLRQVGQAVSRTLARRETRVLVTGTSGVGKSTLVKTLLPEIGGHFPTFDNDSRPVEYRYAAQARLDLPTSNNGLPGQTEVERTQVSLPADFLARGFVLVELTASEALDGDVLEHWLEADLAIVMLSPDCVAPTYVRDHFLSPLRRTVHLRPLWVLHRMDTLRRGRDAERLRAYARQVLLNSEFGGDIVYTTQTDAVSAVGDASLRTVHQWLLDQPLARQHFLRRVRPLRLLHASVEAALSRCELPQLLAGTLLDAIRQRLTEVEQETLEWERR